MQIAIEKSYIEEATAVNIELRTEYETNLNEMEDIQSTVHSSQEDLY